MSKYLTLDLTSDYGAQILNYYLWGQQTHPGINELASNEWMDRKEIEVKISASEYMKYVDTYTSAANFVVFQKFFERLQTVETPSGETILINDKFTKAQMDSIEAKINSEGYYELNIRQMSQILYPNNNEANKFGINGDKNLPTDISHYTLDIHSDNYAERAFVFGSTKMTFEAKDVKFLINAETFEPEFIDNLQIKPYSDDFDFEGGLGTAIPNYYLNKLTNPSNIGRKVKFVFDDFEDIAHQRVSRSDFFKQKAKFEKLNTIEPIDTKNAWVKYFNENIIKSGVIDYLDENGKLVIFGDNGSNTIQGFKAPNLDFDEKLLVEIFTDIKNPYNNKIKNGITYVGGLGSDTIIGTDYDDILYANDKNITGDKSSNTLNGGAGKDKLYGSDGDDTLIGNKHITTLSFQGSSSNIILEETEKDELYGSSGFDTYYAGNGDIIEDDNEGQGRVYFNNTILTGGTYDKEKGCYLSYDHSIEYHLNANTLVVKQDGNTLTINNFDKSLYKSKGYHYLGIDLIEQNEIDIIISDKVVSEGDDSKANSTSVGIKLSRNLKDDEFIIIQKYNFKKQSNELVVFDRSENPPSPNGFKTLREFANLNLLVA